MPFGKPKGYIGILPKITHSREPGIGLGINLTEEYWNALQGKTVSVMDIAVDGSSYLVFGTGEKLGGFLWSIEKEDTTQQLIPYKLLHPGPDVEDLIEFFRIISTGAKTPCRNFMNQIAIDAILSKRNKAMGEDLYRLGHNVCIECRGETLMGGHRACFEALEGDC